MVTNLIVGVAVPNWDRALFFALREAVLGIPEEASLRVLKILNGDRQVYRHVVAHGTLEYQAMLQCFTERDSSLPRLEKMRWCTFLSRRPSRQLGRLEICSASAI